MKYLLSRASMSASSKARLCFDNMKYLLLNIVRKPIDKSEYHRRRQLTYKNVYKLYRENNCSSVKCENLYVILYSKYFTTRFIVEELLSTSFGEEDDEAFKQKFKSMLEDTWANEQELNEAYLNIIERSKTPKDFEEFRRLNEAIHHNDFTKEEKELFYIGTTNTDVYLQSKLQGDINKFLPRRQRITNFLRDYRFFNGWISATGTIIFTSALIYVFPSLSGVISSHSGVS